MRHRRHVRGQNAGMGGGTALRWLIALAAIAAMLPFGAQTVGAAGSATIAVTSFQADGTTPLPFVRFRVTDSHGVVYGPLESAPGTGKVTFTVDPVDDQTTFTIDEETPPACGVAPAPQTAGPLAAGATATIGVSTSFTATCTLGSISAYAYSCPGGTDGSSTAYADYQGACTQTIDGESFAFAGAGQTWTAVTGAFGISGRAPLVGLAPGDYTVGDAGLGAPVVFCSTYPVDPAQGGAPSATTQAKVTKGAISVPLNNQRIACDFFKVANTGHSGGSDNGNVSDNGGGKATVAPAAAPTGTGSVELHLAACPAGYDYGAGNAFADCHGNGIAGQTFTITNQDGLNKAEQTVNVATPGPGIAKFDSLAAGDYFISEDVPTDTVKYYVYCSRAESDQKVTFAYDDSTVDGIDLSLAKGVNVVCDWYIVPTAQGTATTVNVVKHSCPAGYDATGKNLDGLLTDCYDTTSGVDFRLSVQGGPEPTTATTDADGKLAFPDLPAGSYALAENVAGAVDTPVVYCASVAPGTPTPSDAAAYTVTGGAIALTLDGTLQSVDCSWFNIPQKAARNGSIQIVKSLCPAGTTARYYDTCSGNPLGGIDFGVAGPSGFSASDTTDDAGKLTFGNLAQGAYTITENAPDPAIVAIYVVDCLRDGKTFNRTYDDSTGLRVKLTLPQGADIVCFWYNVPPAKATPTPTPGPTPTPTPGNATGGSVTVVKFLCQGKANDAYTWAKDCTNYGAGAEFALSTLGGKAAGAGTTDADGKLTFSKLANGAYALDETSGNWCHAEADHVDANGNVLVQNGGPTTVSVYNCGKKNVNVLPNTGTGPRLAGAGRTGDSALSAFAGPGAPRREWMV